MADPECIRKLNYEPSFDFRRNPYADPYQYGMDKYSSRRLFRPLKGMPFVSNRRTRPNRHIIFDDEEEYYRFDRRREAVRYGSRMMGSMYEDEEEYYREHIRHEAERACIRLQKEIEEEPDEYIKTMLEMRLMEMRLERLRNECTSLHEEQQDLKHENNFLKRERDAFEFDDEYAPPTKKAKSPNVPILRSDRNFSAESKLWYDEENFKKNSPDFYDYDAITDSLL